MLMGPGGAVKIDGSRGQSIDSATIRGMPDGSGPTNAAEYSCAATAVLHDRGWPWFRTILTALVICRGLVLLCVMPPFEAWDEYQHVGYLAYLAETGERPVLGHANVPVGLLGRLSAFPHSQSALRQLSGWGVVDYAAYWSRVSRGERPASASVTHCTSLPLPGSTWAALLPPGLAFVQQARRRQRPEIDDRRIATGQSAAHGGVGLDRAGLVDCLVRDVRLAALCGLLIAMQPLFLTNGVRVANDALGVFLATAAIAVAMRLSRRHVVASSFGLGVVVGLAVLAKTVNLGLLPFVATWWTIAVFRNRNGQWIFVSTRQAFASAVAVLIGFLIVTQYEFRDNWRKFGSPTVMQEAVANRAAGRGAVDLVRTTQVIAWREWAEKLWFRDSLTSGGWSWAGKHEHLRSRHEFLAGLGLLGWGWLLVPFMRRRILGLFRDPGTPLVCLTLCLGYAGAMAYPCRESQLCWGSIATNPWYAAAAYPWFLLLVSGGAFAWPAGRLRALLPAAIAVVFLEVEACTVLGSMTALYAGSLPGTKPSGGWRFSSPHFSGRQPFTRRWRAC